MSDGQLAVDVALAEADYHARQSILTTLTTTRIAKGLTQGDVAARMGCPVKLVAALDAGAVDPRVSALQRYARALGGQVTITATVTVVIGEPDHG